LEVHQNQLGLASNSHYEDTATMPMSDAKLKCSNCGAELTNLIFGWGKKQWLWGLLSFVPLIIFFIWINQRLLRHNDDFATDIAVTLLERKTSGDQINVLGKLKNNGEHTWNRVTVEAEVYDKAGKFLDESSDYLSMTLAPDSEEYFRITLRSADPETLDESAKVVLKVTDANEDRF
jgi:hypothetical protein